MNSTTYIVPKSRKNRMSIIICSVLIKNALPVITISFMAVGALGHTHVRLLDKPIDIFAFRKTVYGCIQVWQLP